MDNSNKTYLLADWKSPIYDAQVYLPERMKLWIRLSYVCILFMLVISIAIGGSALYVMSQNSKSIDVINAHEIENQELSFALRSLKEGASKLKSIDAWIEEEFSVSSMIYSITDKIHTTKIDRALISIGEDRSLVNLDVAAAGSAQGINEAFGDVTNSLKESHFSILSLDQPRHPGGSKLQVELKKQDVNHE